jgi:GMP synthase (glutamine-hydrolysing)
MEQEMVLVLDFGGRYNQLIARKIREANVYCEVLPYDVSIDRIREKNPKGIIFTWEHASVNAPDAPQCRRKIFELGIPILGICHDNQLMADMMAGAESIPEDPKITACTDSSPVAVIEDPVRKLYGVQFHPEEIHTRCGGEIIRDFLYRICGCTGRWNAADFVEKSIQSIRKKVGSQKVLCALSGGVDSSVAAVLVHQAIGRQLTCIFVDHGLLRKDEGDQVEQIFREQFHLNLIRVNARQRFLNRLKGVVDPEKKRKIIGEEFIRVFEEEAKKIGKVDFLVQGTIYPDVIESGGRNRAGIKSHHNVGGLPEHVDFKELIEPLRELFKDEVRKVGEELGIPHDIVWRQPFPGPGLAVRVLGEVTEEKLEILREADAILREEIARAGLDREIWQYFAVLPGISTVGVRGDERTYDHTVGLRAVMSIDGMTVDWARIPYDVLEIISSRIVNEVPHVSRVVYDITTKPPATIEWE